MLRRGRDSVTDGTADAKALRLRTRSARWRNRRRLSMGEAETESRECGGRRVTGVGRGQILPVLKAKGLDFLLSRNGKPLELDVP